MGEEEIVIDVDGYGDWMDSEKALGVVIICAPTGVFCTAQVGGHACNHPAIEGYPIYLRSTPYGDRAEFDSALALFNDCKWGCGINWGSEYNDKYKLDYGTAIDKFLKEFINSRRDDPIISPHILFSFDYERLDEVMEGWWPVLVQFKNTSIGWSLSKGKQDYYYDKKFKGYLYFDNCD